MRLRGRSGELKAFEFDVGGAEVGEVVVGLLGEPGFGAAAENFGEADGHFGRDALTSSERVVRVTPRAAAARVMVKPSGSIHWRRTKPPGWGGFFIGMVRSPSVAILPRQSFRGNASMIVEIIYVERIAVSETKDHSPVSPDSNRPRAFHFTLERM